MKLSEAMRFLTPGALEHVKQRQGHDWRAALKRTHPPASPDKNTWAGAWN